MRRSVCHRRFEEEERQLREKREMIRLALDDEKKIWTRSSPADPYYQRHPQDTHVMVATERTRAQCGRFRTELAERAARARAELPPVALTPPGSRCRLHNCGGSESDETSSDSESEDETVLVTCGSESDETSSDSESEDETVLLNEELERKSRHPYRLHPELWYNDPGKMNVGDVCRCSIKSRQAGIRHNIYAGEEAVPRCDPWTNNADRLFHYRVLICPPTNFLVSSPTSIQHDGHEFIFEGLSLLSHYRLTELPPCHIIRFNIEYTVLYIEEKLPDNFVLEEVELFKSFLYDSLLEMVDLDLFPHADADKQGCPVFHLFPRFVRDIADNGKEILSLNEVLAYLLRSDGPLVADDELAAVAALPLWEWQARADKVRGMLVTHPGRKPSCIRLDQLDREVLPGGEQPAEGELHHPEIVHFGIRPPQLSYAGNPEYQKAWREYVKYRHLLANLPKPSMEDKRKLMAKESQLQNLRLQAKLKRDVTVSVSSQGFRKTGLMADVVQHALFLPVLVCHLRFHKSLDVLEETIDYRFKNRWLLQLALTHPSYRENHGTNPDHSRNSLSNCGIRQPEYGDRCINYTASRKRGLNILINIMSQFGKKEATESRITHNERLEFLGDAVVEFLTSIHLFFMFPNLEEGGLATYRAAIVQNQHLAVLARHLRLHEYLLYAHGSDLCHDLELRHAMANCFEALMGALFLDAGIEVADKVFSRTLYVDDDRLLAIWQHYPPHPLQEQEPRGDRKWIDKFPRLQQMREFEKLVGVEFMHIRLLARSFTDRSIGFNNLTLGSNQRLEFLGDTVLQLIASEYLYRHFPEHHEGHLSLLRSSLVNNRTQAVVCTDLGMTEFAAYSHLKTEIKMKDKADLLEAFIGALYVDKGLEFCRKFCEVCFFPRLQLFILNQDWNDPKSKLQQCCLTLRNMDGSEPDIPVYKVIECMGPTNTRVYSVAVYFQGKRLAKASGHSIQMAEMNAATMALANCKHLFPQLDHQNRVIAKSIRIQTKRLEEQLADGCGAAAASSSSSSVPHE
ncbi:ribonuclease 3-like [Pollicipes pollicipes]|uniref:ribonuclease 3-like n=1 Tax=Pollicipes pollicipes TaxID=41117 RepID=UPI0018857963|nr:ribonuclease 3-like [Pollicipes pollicipes]